MPTSKNFAGVVADANVLLAAAAGRAASRIFSQFRITTHSCRFTCDEVEKYLAPVASKYAVDIDRATLNWNTLTIRIHERNEYASKWEEARRAIDARDPDDAHVLALAMTLDLPIWSNDKDLAGHGVDVYPTAVLLAILEARSRE